MRRTLKGLSTLAALACLGLPTASAQDQPTNPAPTQPQERTQTKEGTAPNRHEDLRNLTDAQFLQMAATSGMMEVSLAKLVGDHTDNEALENFAKRMITDHNKANEELVRLAEAKKIAIPNALDERHQQLYDRFANLEEGTAFEQAYIQQQVRAHQQAVNLFTTKAGNARDPDIKAFARKTEPTLRQHLQMAQQLAGGRTTGTTTTTTTPAPTPTPTPPPDRDRNP